MNESMNISKNLSVNESMSEINKNIINAPSSQWMNIGWINELINETMN